MTEGGSQPGGPGEGGADHGQMVPAMQAATEAAEEPQKLLRIGSMVRQMLEEVRRAPLDEEGRKHLREVHERSMRELRGILSDELRDELDEVTIPFGAETPTESELRIAQAQLVGWLEGLFHGIQAALWAQQLQSQQQLGQLRRQALPGQEGEQGPRPGGGHYL